MIKSETAIVSVVDDEFAVGFHVLLSSLIELHSHLDVAVLILSEPDGLQPRYRNRFREVYDSVHCLEMAPSYMPSLRQDGYSYLRTPSRLLVAFLILEAFALKDFRRVVCLDADILCTGDITNLLECPADFAAVRAVESGSAFPRNFFNSGVLVIGERHLSGPTYYDLTIHANLTGADPKTGKADQALLNSFLYPHRVSWLPRKYNTTKRALPDSLEDVAGTVRDRDIRLLHYVGSKPWTCATSQHDLNFYKVEALWHRACERYVPDWMVSDMLDRRVSMFERTLRSLG